MPELYKNMTPNPFEPKYSNRWIVEFGEPFNTIPNWVVKSVKRPKLKIKEGKSKWTNLIITCYDPIGLQSTEDKLLESLKLIKSNNQQITVTVKFMDPTGMIMNGIKYNCTIKLIDFGDLDYSSTDLHLITMKFKLIRKTLVV